MNTKKVLIMTMILCIIGFATACKENSVPPTTGGVFAYFPFLDNFSTVIQEDEVFFIKGVALDITGTVRKIALVEDLKGNFPKKAGTTFTVVGAGINFIEDNAIDYFNVYEKQDTLIMFLRHSNFSCNDAIVPDQPFAKLGDFSAGSCGSAFVKLSNGYVMGSIFGTKYTDTDGYTFYDWSQDTIRCEEFQKMLNKFWEVKLCE